MTTVAAISTSSSDPPPSSPDSPPSPSSEYLLIPNLPDDVAVNCIARIPRPHYPKLSLVSKSWRSVIRSTALFAARTLLRTTQTSLYLNLRIDSSFHWYTLLPKSNTPQKPFVIPLSPSPSQPVGPAFAVLGPKIYVIGGSVNEIPLNCMWIYDCRFNRWEPGPRMRVGREFAAAGVVGGRIFVVGGCVVDNWARSLNWAESFNPVTEEWTPVPSPVEVREKWMHASAVIGGKIYAMADRGGVVYDVGADKWGSVSKRLDLGWRGRAAVVGGVLYCYDYLGKIRGYDVEENVWKELSGVGKGLPRFLCGATPPLQTAQIRHLSIATHRSPHRLICSRDLRPPCARSTTALSRDLPPSFFVRAPIQSGQQPARNSIHSSHLCRCHSSHLSRQLQSPIIVHRPLLPHLQTSLSCTAQSIESPPTRSSRADSATPPSHRCFQRNLQPLDSPSLKLTLHRSPPITSVSPRHSTNHQQSEAVTPDCRVA